MPFTLAFTHANQLAAVSAVLFKHTCSLAWLSSSTKTFTIANAHGNLQASVAAGLCEHKLGQAHPHQAAPAVRLGSDTEAVWREQPGGLGGMS